MNRHLSRIIILQSLYEWDFRQTNPIEVASRNVQAFKKEVDLDFIDKVLKGIIEKNKKIDEKIQNAAPEWPLAQIAPIDKNILRIAIFGLLFCDDVPPKVAINEAVELGKAFGSDNSSKFINGVLGTLFRSSDKYKKEEDEFLKEKNVTKKSWRIWKKNRNWF